VKLYNGVLGLATAFVAGHKEPSLGGAKLVDYRRPHSDMRAQRESLEITIWNIFLCAKATVLLPPAFDTVFALPTSAGRS